MRPSSASHTSCVATFVYAVEKHALLLYASLELTCACFSVCPASSILGTVRKRTEQCPYKVVCRNLGNKVQKATLYVDGQKVG